ncbi:ABC transporter substrate-binding protein [Georgenia sp. SYP-B2076]|uniref:ABC transporter substrate-binding protein n=1 Tax=Georgenia sp. SYP-B2076 TaxID=2495881 RepID=UPI001F0C8229|nr:ABC transporter substrate-binding protein [Georgenia sp. SYP-B2076]
MSPPAFGELPAISRRSVLRGAALLGGLGLLSACGSRAEPAATTAAGGITVQDQRGTTLTFDRPVTRIVTLPMPAASLAIAVDASADHLVGMNEASFTAIRDGIMATMFPRATGIAHDVAGQDFTPNVESILALRPDVVVQWADEGTGIIAPLENAGLKVLGVTYGTQDDLDTWTTLFATILGKPDRAKEMISRSDAALREVKARTAKVAGAAPKVLYFNRFSAGLKVAGPRTYNDFYIRLVGAENPASGPTGVRGPGMVGVDVEQVLGWDPDIVLLGNFDEAMPDDVYGDAVWGPVSAVRSRRVYKVPLGGYRWDPPGQESPLMWRWLSRIVFPGDDGRPLRDDVRDAYGFLYGYRPTDADLGRILWSEVNGGSAGYGQFDAR